MHFLEAFLFWFHTYLSSSPSCDWQQTFPSKQALPLCPIPSDSSSTPSAACTHSWLPGQHLQLTPQSPGEKGPYKSSLGLKGKADFLWIVFPLQRRQAYWPILLVRLPKPGHGLRRGCIFQLNWNKTQPYLSCKSQQELSPSSSASLLLSLNFFPWTLS